MGFQGFLDEATAGSFLLAIRNASNVPIEPDAAPTWRLYGPNGLVANGSGSATSLETGTIAGATNTSPIVITSALHGLTAGMSVTIASVGGNTNANGTFILSAIATNTFTLLGSTGNSGYTSGGTWKSTGLYRITLSGSVLSSLSAGTTYTLVVYWTESAAQRSATITFTVR